MSLEGKVCVVTGASSGIGEAIAVLFAERKASVVLCGRSESRLENALKRCQEVSGQKYRFISVTGDVTDQEVRVKIIKEAVDAFGRIDVLIPNAGVLSHPTSIFDTTEENYDHVMNANSKAVFFLTKEAIPWLEKTKGSVVIISSIAALTASSSALYSMSKASVDQMSRCLAADLASKGIRVNTVNPTFVKTRFLRGLIPSLAESESLNAVDSFLDTKAPLHPLYGRIVTPEEVARATAFLASDEASFVTGQNLSVDGGISIYNQALH